MICGWTAHIKNTDELSGIFNEDAVDDFINNLNNWD